MTLRAVILLLVVLARTSLAQDAGGADRILEEMEARLQEQRAAALRTRLIIASDELRQLHARSSAAGDAATAALVKADMEAIDAAVKQLTGMARRQAGPPEPGELKENEKLSATALAKRRIDRILARFTAVSREAGQQTGATGPAPRAHDLKIAKARLRNSFDASDDEGDYWAAAGNYAIWTVPDAVPGKYGLVLRYTAGPDSGGTAVIKLAGESLTVNVPRGDKSGREQQLPAGTVTIREPGVDIRVENAGLAEGAKRLWKLEGVLLQPAAKRP